MRGWADNMKMYMHIEDIWHEAVDRIIIVEGMITEQVGVVVNL
jgi:hypothetical protein